MGKYIPAMLAKEADEPFTDKDWVFEIKWDGYRAIAELSDGKVQLYSRNGNSFLNDYPVVVEALQQWDIEDAVVDGEIVVLDEKGNPDFQKLQYYKEDNQHPIQFQVFDLLRLNGKETYGLTLLQRKELLQEIIPKSPIIKYSDHIDTEGEAFFEVAKQKHLEGIMAKRKDSHYHPGKRTPEWLKIKHHQTEEAVIAGFTEPRGSRKYFGALILGMYDNDKLKYIGHTGSGFDYTTLKDIYARLEPTIIDKSPFDENVKTNMPVTWVQPKLVAEMKFSEWTKDGKLRHPIFLRLREDKKPKDVHTDESKTVNMATIKKAKAAKPKKAKAAKPKKARATRSAATKDVVNNENELTYKFGSTQVKTTNRTKIFFPDSGITKGDVIDYYERMADYILPYLKDRPESLYRTPNGIKQKGFFHKDAGSDAPSFVKSKTLFSESTNKDIEYILCNNKASLIYMANLGCIEINPWHSQLKALDKPDYMIIDIDPSDKNTFDEVIEAALAVKEILDRAGAESFCKTSGASGLHVYVPMGKKYDYDQVKDFAHIICTLATHALPKITTLERSLSKRKKNQIYMDYLQNRRGQTIACAYSIRPKPGATVSTPLLWKEVKKGLHPSDFTIHDFPKRVEEVGDIFKGILTGKTDLKKCIENLEKG